MAKGKKKAYEMTDEELKRRIFPKKVREELERIAHEKDDQEGVDSEHEQSSQ